MYAISWKFEGECLLEKDIKIVLQSTLYKALNELHVSCILIIEIINFLY